MINISFFSYKGGAGRTSLLYNVLPYLALKLEASNSEPIIVIDLDIDSKGLSYLIDESSGFNTIQVLKGEDSIGFNERYGSVEEHPFFGNLQPIGKKIGLTEESNRSVLFISANATSENNKYLNNADNFDSANVSLRPLARLCSDMHCKAIIMDTPAGEQLAGRVALGISQKIVTVMRITEQFRKGTYDFLHTVSADYCAKEFIVVPNAVPDPTGTPYQMEEYMSEIEARTIQEVNPQNKLNLTFLSNGRQGINEVRLFKFCEKNLYKESQSRALLPDEISALEKYKLLAGELVK